MRSRVLLPLAALAAASAWCVVLLVVRKHEFGYSRLPLPRLEPHARVDPARAGGRARTVVRAQAVAVELVAVGAAWLLFLPNAPYVLTDFIHLGERHRLFDTLLIASFAFTSLALGFASLLLVQFVVTRAAGAMIGWATALASLFAASVGIYLGRVLRFNSWDVVHRPGQALGDLDGAARRSVRQPLPDRLRARSLRLPDNRVPRNGTDSPRSSGPPSVESRRC